MKKELDILFNRIIKYQQELIHSEMYTRNIHREKIHNDLLEEKKKFPYCNIIVGVEDDFFDFVTNRFPSMEMSKFLLFNNNNGLF